MLANQIVQSQHGCANSGQALTTQSHGGNVEGHGGVVRYLGMGSGRKVVKPSSQQPPDESVQREGMQSTEANLVDTDIFSFGDPLRTISDYGSMGWITSGGAGAKQISVASRQQFTDKVNTQAGFFQSGWGDASVLSASSEAPINGGLADAGDQYGIKGEQWSGESILQSNIASLEHEQSLSQGVTGGIGSAQWMGFAGDGAGGYGFQAYTF